MLTLNCLSPAPTCVPSVEMLAALRIHGNQLGEKIVPFSSLSLHSVDALFHTRPTLLPAVSVMPATPWNTARSPLLMQTIRGLIENIEAGRPHPSPRPLKKPTTTNPKGPTAATKNN